MRLRRTFILVLLCAMVLPNTLRAETGAAAWLRNAPLIGEATKKYASLPAATFLTALSPVLQTAQSELVRGVHGMLGRNLRIVNPGSGERAVIIGTIDQIKEPDPGIVAGVNLAPDGFLLTWGRVRSVALRPGDEIRIVGVLDGGEGAALDYVAIHPNARGAQPASSAAKLRIAITFDDLPAHGSLPPGETRLHVASQIIDTLRQAGVPAAYGFMNGALLDQQPADAAVLRAWRAAGNPLGNHTFSHMSLNQHSLEEFQADITRNEPLLDKFMSAGNGRWLRFPYLAEGDTEEKRAGIRNYLLQHGYKVAGTTMSFADYLYNEPYARCRAKSDQVAVALLEDAFLAAADESIRYYRNLSHTLYGRDIPYVLLMHLGAFDAKMLPRLLQLYRSRGFEFVTLEEAERDEFYRQDTDLHLPPGPDNLEGIMGQRKLFLPPHAVPAPQFDSLCR